MLRRTPSHAAILLLSAAAAYAQAPRPLTVDWVFGEEAVTAARLPKFAWTTSDDVLLLDERPSPGQRTIERIRAKTGQRSAAVDAAAALASLRAISKEDTPASLGWPEALDPAGTAGVYVLGDDLYALDFAGVPLPAPDGDGREGVASAILAGRPQGRLRPRQRSLGRRSRARSRRRGSPPTAAPRSSTARSPGSTGRRSSTAGTPATGGRRIPGLSPYFRTDESGVDVTTFTDFSPAVPREIRQRYPRTGRPNPTVRLGVVAATGGNTSWMDPAAVPYEYILGVDWLPDSRSLAVQTMNRAQTKLDVWRFDVASARATLVLSDSDPALVYHKEIQFADGGTTWIVSFEVDGHPHLFRYGADGKRKNAVTQGPWSVRGSGGYDAPQGSAVVDDANGWIYFSSIEKSPLESHLYRIRPDGSGKVRITKEEGTHKATFSPDRRYFVDAYSNRNTLPSLVLYDASGKRLSTLWESRPDFLAPYGLTQREFLTIPAPDGFPFRPAF